MHLEFSHCCPTGNHSYISQVSLSLVQPNSSGKVILSHRSEELLVCCWCVCVVVRLQCFKKFIWIHKTEIILMLLNQLINEVSELNNG